MSEFNEKKNNINLRRDIKSAFNLEMIFSFLEQRQKLNIITYNKELQKIFGFNIQDYKEISGRYKIDGKNGKGKEYTLDKIFWYLKENIKILEEMEKEKNIILIVN